MNRIKDFVRNRIIEPSTMAAISVLLYAFFPEARGAEQDIKTLIDSLPDVVASVIAIVAILTPERGAKDAKKLE